MSIIYTCKETNVSIYATRGPAVGSFAYTEPIAFRMLTGCCQRMAKVEPLSSTWAVCPGCSQEVPVSFLDYVGSGDLDYSLRRQSAVRQVRELFRIGRTLNPRLNILSEPATCRDERACDRRLTEMVEALLGLDDGRIG